MNFSQGHSGAKVQCESCLFSQGKTQEFTKMGESHELFVLALSLVWIAGATADFLLSERGSERKKTTKETWFSFWGSGSPGKCSGSSFFCPDQVLLNENFHSRPGWTEVLSKEFWGWEWGSKLDPHLKLFSTHFFHLGVSVAFVGPRFWTTTPTPTKIHPPKFTKFRAFLPQFVGSLQTYIFNSGV